jgi:tetratricopeptide (TPR) repeat protein
MSDATQIVERLRAAKAPAGRLAILKAYAAENDGRGTTGTYEFESNATTIGVDVPDIAKECGEFLKGTGGDASLRFLCLAVAFNGLRRAYQADEARGILERATTEFGNVPLFGHFLAMALDGGSAADMRKGLAVAEKAHRELPDNAGAAHTCAVLIADLASREDLANKAEELDRALKLVDEAIALESTKGRFYHTRARIKRLLADYDGANSDIAKALELERDSNDAAERRGVYLIERAMIEADRHISSFAKEARDSAKRLTEESHTANTELKRETKELRKTLEASQIQAIEVIGFVTAILGLVMATLGEIKGQSPQDALTVLAGVAVLLFGAVFFGSWMLRRRMGK